MSCSICSVIVVAAAAAAVSTNSASGSFFQLAFSSSSSSYKLRSHLGGKCELWISRIKKSHVFSLFAHSIVLCYVVLHCM